MYKQIYDYLYNHSDYHNGAEFAGRNLKNLCSNYIQQGQSVIDIGCSNGAGMQMLKNIGAEPKGIDIADKAIAIAMSKGFDCKISSFCNIPYEDSEFDHAFCSDVIEHVFIEDIDSMISEIHRVIKQYVICQIATEEEGNKNPIKILKNNNIVDENFNTLHTSLFEPLFWKNKFESFGFTTVFELIENGGAQFVFKKNNNDTNNS